MTRKDRTREPGGINSPNRTIMINGKPVKLTPMPPVKSWRYLIPLIGLKKAKAARHKTDLKCQDFSDGFWLRECGTIPGAPKRKPSKKAIHLSKIKPDPNYWIK